MASYVLCPDALAGGVVNDDEAGLSRVDTSGARASDIGDPADEFAATRARRCTCNLLAARSGSITLGRTVRTRGLPLAEVVSSVAGEQVTASAALDEVAPTTAIRPVAAFAAEEARPGRDIAAPRLPAIVSPATMDAVAARAAADCIDPASTVDRVVSAEPNDYVDATRPEDPVVTLRADDRRAEAVACSVIAMPRNRSGTDDAQWPKRNHERAQRQESKYRPAHR